MGVQLWEFKRMSSVLPNNRLKAIRRLKVLTVFGTRPEAIKMAPIIQEMACYPDLFESVVCVTAQHRQMLDQVLSLFNITPQHDLNIMQPNQDLYQVTCQVLMGMKSVLEQEKPDVVLVHGDTTTTMATTLAAFYQKIPVGHVEAGLRTWDIHYPFPEEINRVITDSIAKLYFAPTEQAKANLLKCNVPESRIYVTGNTVIDALFYTLAQKDSAPQKHSEPLKYLEQANDKPVVLDENKRLILVTVHRRENFGEPLQQICKALQQLIDRYPDIEIVLPVHPNPNVSTTVNVMLAGRNRIHLIQPLDYEPFCRLMERSYLILTDSGGIQEEAPSLRKPVLVFRNETERPEAVELGTVKLTGPNCDRIFTESSILLDNPTAYAIMTQLSNPYGDGLAAKRIVEHLRCFGLQLF
jgi:UDP-N-acetylglucosamine 2-epimerase (non-hydrolysing)